MYLILLCLLLKKVALLFCPGEARETFQIFSRTYKQNFRTFQYSKKIQDFFRMWQPCHMKSLFYQKLIVIEMTVICFSY